MSAMNKSINIKAPVAKVFEFVTTPENWTRYVTSLVAVKNVSDEKPKVGTTFAWDYKMMGIKVSGKGEVTNCVKNKSFGLTLKGKMQINEAYEFVGETDGSTTLTVHVDYELPSEVLQVFANSKLVDKINAMESRGVLEKIKVFCETE